METQIRKLHYYTGEPQNGTSKTSRFHVLGVTGVGMWCNHQLNGGLVRVLPMPRTGMLAASRNSAQIPGDGQ